MITTRLDGVETVIAALQRAGNIRSAEMRRAMQTAVRRVARGAVYNLSNKVLKRRTGTLASSIRTRVDSDLSGTVGTNVVYARIHEYGGTTKAHVIEPRNAKVLRWATAMSIKTRKATRYAFAMKVNHPGSVIPKRPYLEPAYNDARELIEADFTAALERVLTG